MELETMDDSKQNCWAKMPPDLLTDVLMRIEAESNWPPRKDVVSYAGVCRSWRKIMKEIVKCPQLSGKLTFPDSLKQPGSVGSPTECFILTDRANQIFYFCLHMTKSPYYDGEIPSCCKEGSSSCIGILRSNFLGTKFRVYDIDPLNADAATKCPSSMGS
ncbi:unnamed protein product [Lactuca virosa]|uniref:F-box domain-containing protein n=1 Tax=Lactuca virosa TaxID=75947 RepID=A0AAU9MW96_9ASTR|nr:unnamed protein product [Lactuca virosa]